ncbi:MAG: methyl-accepting chemotaxis protein [Oligoflexales bacterium]
MLKAFMKRLSLTQKILGIFGLFLIPMTFLLYTVVTAYNASIEFSEKEYLGDRYLVELVTLFEHVTFHKVDADMHLNKKADALNKLRATESKVDEAIKEVEKVDARIGADLQFTDDGLAKRSRSNNRISVVKADWEKLKGEWNKLSATESNDRHQNIINNIRTMITHAGDTSNLILDPDLDSYYLMDIVLLALPQTQDRMQQITLFMTHEMGQESLSFPSRTKAASHYTMLKEADTDRITADAQTVVNEDPNFYGVNPKIQKEYLALVNSYAEQVAPFLEVLNMMSTEGKINVSLEQFNKIAETSMRGSFRLWHESVTILDQLLQTRLNDYYSMKRRAIVYSAIMLVALVMIGLVTTSRISKSLIQQVIVLETQSQATHKNSISMSKASENLSTTAAQQVASIQESIAAVSEIGSTVAQTAKQATASHEVTVKVSDKTKEGNRIMDSMVRSMDTIEQANLQLENFSEIIGKIRAKTNVINDIVFKTQLLSFNASIEAARAGQHGRGFAVVAGEVGNLAQVSGSAATEIRSLLDDSQRQVSALVENTRARVKEGKSISQDAQTIFSEIAHQIETISEHVQDVNEASKVQKIGVDQISQTMLQMNDTTQSNKSSAQEAENLSYGLLEQSKKLRNVASSLNATIRGQAAMRPAMTGGDMAMMDGQEQGHGMNRPTSSRSNVRKMPTNQVHEIRPKKPNGPMRKTS